MTTPKDDQKSTSSSFTPPYPQLFLRQSDPLPPPINGTLRLVFLSDTHGRHEKIPLPLPEGDILFHLGDASNRGNISEMRSFVQWLKRNSFHKERVVIDGNHDRDRIMLEGPSKRDFMAEYKGVARVLRNEVVEVAGGKMSVVGLTWDACQSQNFTEAKDSIQTWSESAVGEGKRKVDLVLSHFPPNVEGGGRGWQYGSELLSHFVKDVNPSLHCFGHIHYARGVRAFNSDIMMVNCASTWNESVVVDYCPHRKRALMIHCPVPEESIKAHLRCSKFPKEWYVAEDERDSYTMEV
eukprot:CAMPEP_0201889776 /NCGR_PEP_ID=MMETSP0902-20130614/30816_1 /ASSEMBLY_ACC=CAM_ASM_000551 /TAXON_ID=420261 /ORGANISM="Thalassiosira antarctica, Strain CCMP982" /LENGTH=294 /DNA_ID=CAMNT_0048420451 /DNA_START=271 /DNA_END=1155 /DNA_ORIENTATION=+